MSNWSEKKELLLLKLNTLAEAQQAELGLVNEDEAQATLERIEEIRLKLQQLVGGEVSLEGPEEEDEETSIREKYDQMIELAEGSEDKIIALTDSKMSVLGNLVNKKHDAIIQNRLEKTKQTLAGVSNIFGHVAAGFQDLFDLTGKEMAGFAFFQQTLTTAQIILDTASAISSVARNAAASSITPIGLAIKIAASVGTLLTWFAKAKALVSSAEIPQKKFGGWFNVVGRDDKQSYNAKYIGSGSTGMLPSHPVVLASEAGPEYFVSNSDLQNPQVLNHVRIIENIVRSGGIKQMQEGGATAELPVEITPNQTFEVNVLLEIKETLESLTSVLGNGIYAVLEDEILIKGRNRLSKLDEAAGGNIGN